MAAAQRVLLVDDDDMVRMVARRELRRSGTPLELADAPTLKRAREIIQKHAVDCVLLDLNLPDGNGAHLAEELLSGPRPPALVVLTAEASPGLGAALLQLGVEDFIHKAALCTDELRWAVQHALRRARTRARHHNPSSLPALLPTEDQRVTTTRRSLVCAQTERVDGWELHATLGRDPLYAHLLGAPSPEQRLQLELRLLRARLTAARMLPRAAVVVLPILASSVRSPRVVRLLLECRRSLPHHRLVAMVWSLEGSSTHLEAAACALRAGGLELGASRLGRDARAMNLLLALRPDWVRLDSQLIARCERHPAAAATVAQLAHLGRATRATSIAPVSSEAGASTVARLAALGVDIVSARPRPTPFHSSRR